MTINNEKPYNNLNPDLIMNAIQSAGYDCTGSLIALNSYENRVYQIGIENSTPLIAKFYRPNRWSNEAILEEHQFALELAEHEIPVIAPLADIKKNTLHEYQGYRFALFPRQVGRALESENLEQLKWVGRFIGRIHAVGACRSFRYRLQINPQNYGYQSYWFLLEGNFIPAELKQEYATLLESLLPIIESNFQQIEVNNCIRLHGDCHIGNILWNNAGPQIIDLDDCMMGPAIQDIWMLVTSENRDQFNAQLEKILYGYQEFYDFNFSELKLIESLRTLRMIYYSAWLAKRWQDPAFPLNFPWFNTLSYWKEQLLHLNEQLKLLDK